MGMPKSDGELVSDALAGDSRSFEEIVRRYERLVFNVIYHHLGNRNEVEDLAQEVFLKVYRALGSYDVERPFRYWITRIAANTSLDEARKARHRRLRLFSDFSEEEKRRLEGLYERSRRGAALTEAEAQKSFRLLQRLLDTLAEKDKMAFVLRELEDLDYVEVAKALGTTPLGARIRVSRSRKRLQRELNRVLNPSREEVS